MLDLKDIDLTFNPGELNCIIGTVGSGKTSLLASVIGELNSVSGEVIQSGSISYVPQVWYLHHSHN